MTAPYCFQPSSGVYVLKKWKDKVAKSIIIHRHLEKMPQVLTETVMLWENCQESFR